MKTFSQTFPLTLPLHCVGTCKVGDDGTVKDRCKERWREMEDGWGQSNDTVQRMGTKTERN